MRVLFAGLLIVAGCSKPNPRNCLEATCFDPAYPFCDVSGMLGGDTTYECIQPSCAPLEFGECREDVEVRCNAAGDDYDLVQCPLGCDAASDGCRLCQPNETACTNGKVATCDAAGVATIVETCPLGCFESEPRCRQLVPSNKLGDYAGLVPSPTDLAVSDVLFETDTGRMRINNAELTRESVLIPASPGGAPIRLYIVNNLVLGNFVTGTSSPTTTPPALAFLAFGTITINGRGTIGAGDVHFAECLPELGMTDYGPNYQKQAGDGGGGHATAGGNGGAINVNASAVGARGGKPSGTDELVPLRGGCPGGGALQLTSMTKIVVNGILDARGYTAETPGGPSSSPAGGAGGGILLEAPEVVLASGSKLIAKGGGGFAPGLAPMPSDDAMADRGYRCQPESLMCGSGGDGATVGIAAMNGRNLIASDVPYQDAGGGGGGLGRVRINTTSGQYTKSSDVVEAASLTTGTVVGR